MHLKTNGPYVYLRGYIKGRKRSVYLGRLRKVWGCYELPIGRAQEIAERYNIPLQEFLEKLSRVKRLRVYADRRSYWRVSNKVRRKLAEAAIRQMRTVYPNPDREWVRELNELRTSQDKRTKELGETIALLILRLSQARLAAKHKRKLSAHQQEQAQDNLERALMSFNKQIEHLCFIPQYGYDFQTSTIQLWLSGMLGGIMLGGPVLLHFLYWLQADGRSPSLGVCEYCGKIYIQRTLRQRFCSDRCRKAAYKARHSTRER